MTPVPPLAPIINNTTTLIDISYEVIEKPTAVVVIAKEDKDLFGSSPFDSEIPKDLFGSILFNHVTNSQVSSEETSPSEVIAPTLPEPLMVSVDCSSSPKHKSSKYHLINESSKGVDVINNVLPVKLLQNKILYSAGKKASKAAKKGVAAAAGGFINMSFEDFPSDENNDDGQRNARGAYEVIRDTDKRFGSLKRRSNPFT